MRYQVGDRVITRKPHPCGGREWEIVRVGSDIKIKCLSCGRIVMLDVADLFLRIQPLHCPQSGQFPKQVFRLRRKTIQEQKEIAAGRNI